MIKHLPVCTLLGLGSLLPLGALAQEPAVEVPRTTPLTKAIRLEQYAEAAKHLSPQLVNQPDAGKYHPLTYAAFTGNTTLMESLIKAGADVNRVEHNGKTALYVAAREGNPDAVKLLIKHGAKYPDLDNRFQPAKAAILAGSRDSLKILLEKFPDLDINAKWHDPKKRNRWTIGSAANYAAMHGLNEIGMTVLDHGGDLKVTRWQDDWTKGWYTVGDRDQKHYWQGKKALNLAAENPACSLEFMQRLLQAGEDPFEKTYATHFGRRTPLDFAAASGNLEKTRLLMQSYDAKQREHYYAVVRAYFIASAWKRDEIVQYFLDYLNEDITDPEVWLAKFGSEISSPDKHGELKVSEVKELLPLTASKKNSKQIKGSVAVISQKGLENTAALLTSILSQLEGTSVLERDRISAVLQESTLRNFGKLDSAELQQNLHLIPAERIILLSQKSLKEGKFIELVTINCHNGIIMNRLALSAEQAADTDFLSQCVRVLSKSLPSEQNTGDSSAIAISFSEIKPELPDEETLTLASRVSATLPYFINQTPKCVQLSRTQLKHLELENAIGQQGAYWAAAWVVDGSIIRPNGGPVSLKLFATNTKTQAKIVVSSPLQQDKLLDSTRKAWAQLAQKIQLPQQLQLSEQDAAFERKLLAANTEWFLKAGYYQEAIQAGQSARILGSEGEDFLQNLVEASYRSLSLSGDKICRHLRRDPRNTEPETRFTLARRLSDYIDLLDTAVLYTEKITRAKDALRGGGKAKTYEDRFHTVFRETALYRTILDDSIITHHHGGYLKLIDQKIAQMLSNYLDKMHGHKQELFTLITLLSDDEHHYLYSHHPTIYERCQLRIEALLGEIKPRYRKSSLDDYLDLCHVKIRELKLCYKPIDLWEKAAKRLVAYGWPEELPLAHSILASLAKTPEDRERHTRKTLLDIFGYMRRYDPEYGYTTLGYLTWNLDLNSEFYRSSFLFNDYKPDTLLTMLEEEPEKLAKTAELRRMLGTYYWRLQISKTSNSSWEESIKKFLEERNNRGLLQAPKAYDYSGDFNSRDWLAARAVYASRKDASSIILNLIDDLAGIKKEAKPTASITPLPLGQPIMLTERSMLDGLGCYLHSYCTVIDGDELWVPASFVEANKLDTNPLKPIEHRHKFAILVYNMANKTLRSIPLPDSEVPRFRGRERLIIGQDYIYYLSHGHRSRPFSFFSISRKTHEVHKLEMPLPELVAVSDKVIGNKLYVSVSNFEFRPSSKALNQVLLIEGSKIVKIVVSGQRKPAESPLDTPDTLVSFLDHQPDKLYLFSNHRNGYINPESQTLAVLDIKANSWNVLPQKDFKASFQKAWLRQQQAAKAQPVYSGFQYQQARYFPFSHTVGLKPGTMPIALRGLHAPIRVAGSQTTPSTGTNQQRQNQYHRVLPLQVSKIDHPAFRTPVYFVKGTDHQCERESITEKISSYTWTGWWFTQNDLIESKLFKTEIIGKHEGKYILMLSYGDKSLPAIWMVDENEIGKHLAPILEQQPGPLDFNQSQQKNLFRTHLAEVSWKPEQVQRIDNNGCDESPCLKILGGKEHSIHIKACENRSFQEIAFYAQRWHWKGELNFQIHAKIQGQWREVYQNEKLSRVQIQRVAMPNIRVDFPEPVTEIKITTSCADKAWLLIDDIHIN